MKTHFLQNGIFRASCLGEKNPNKTLHLEQYRAVFFCLSKQGPHILVLFSIELYLIQLLLCHVSNVAWMSGSLLWTVFLAVFPQQHCCRFC